jgi:hypothetical protein
LAEVVGLEFQEVGEAGFVVGVVLEFGCEGTAELHSFGEKGGGRGSWNSGGVNGFRGRVCFG